jgi:hypothetical protein
MSVQQHTWGTALTDTGAVSVPAAADASHVLRGFVPVVSTRAAQGYHRLFAAGWMARCIRKASKGWRG